MDGSSDPTLTLQQYFWDVLRAALIPGCDAARQDTFNGAPVEVALSKKYPLVHQKPPQAPHNKKMLVCSRYH